MELAFKTQISGKPTQFVEKIWEGLLTHQVEIIDAEKLELGEYLEKVPSLGKHVPGSSRPKLHSFREDPKDRWHAGKSIHFVINSQTPNRVQFAPKIKCISTQRAEIKYTTPNSVETIAYVYLDGRVAGTATFRNCQLFSITGRMQFIALNDGFESVNDFFEYFDKDWSGKLIHWTNLKY